VRPWNIVLDEIYIDVAPCLMLSNLRSDLCAKMMVPGGTLHWTG
jgi:hypothetical protein